MYLSCGLQRDVLGLVGTAQRKSDLLAFWHCRCRFVTCSVVASGLALSRRGRSSQLSWRAVCWQGKGQGQAGMSLGWHPALRTPAVSSPSLSCVCLWIRGYLSDTWGRQALSQSLTWKWPLKNQGCLGALHKLCFIQVPLHFFCVCLITFIYMKTLFLKSSTTSSLYEI